MWNFDKITFWRNPVTFLRFCSNWVKVMQWQCLVTILENLLVIDYFFFKLVTFGVKLLKKLQLRFWNIYLKCVFNDICVIFEKFFTSNGKLKHFGVPHLASFISVKVFLNLIASSITYFHPGYRTGVRTHNLLVMSRLP
jgi:hypothetical protein